MRHEIVASSFLAYAMYLIILLDLAMLHCLKTHPALLQQYVLIISFLTLQGKRIKTLYKFYKPQPNVTS